MKQKLSFIDRHIGSNQAERQMMLGELKLENLEELIKKTIPQEILTDCRSSSSPFQGDHWRSLNERQAISLLQTKLLTNKIFRSLIGMGYYETEMPAVIRRAIFENPSWYTAYTPYQAEISQGRLEALLNFQTMIIDLTAMEIANASLLDEGTAAAEALSMALAIRREEQADQKKGEKPLFLIDAAVHPQTLAVIKTRAEGLSAKIQIFDRHNGFPDHLRAVAALFQYPDTYGDLKEIESSIERARKNGALTIVATDLLALTLLKPPGEFGADIVVGSSQRFGIPLGYGGPHAAFFATRERYKRLLPGRIVGISKDSTGTPALRLALQTREQHIRREKATSNICTSQVLLAVIASMYGVYHGSDGLSQIARSVIGNAKLAAAIFRTAGLNLYSDQFFDTITVINLKLEQVSKIIADLQAEAINIRQVSDNSISIAFDELSSFDETSGVCSIILRSLGLKEPCSTNIAERENFSLADNFRRTSEFLKAAVFNSYHSEHQLLRYIKHLERKDYSLADGMIPLGSCTMKLNSAVQMYPLSWPEVNRLHPYAPPDQAPGYAWLIADLERMLLDLTGFAKISFQPNSGAQGEFAGLMAVKRYFQDRAEASRNICLIPRSAHGTNPASAILAGFETVTIASAANGDLNVDDLKNKLQEYDGRVACAMITYPSTHGIFEERISEIVRLIHDHGALVYMDGANFNALAGYSRPADFGIDLCHLNLHKTFCVPHGGGGPGVGPLAVSGKLASYLPPVLNDKDLRSELLEKLPFGVVSAAPFGSASLLVISWIYLKLLGIDGLKLATANALLNANYVARKLAPYFQILFKGRFDLVAHECVVDLRKFKECGVEAEDVAKRLIDYGFHAPTVSWPTAGSLMIEPTESESKAELDRFIEAMIHIRQEISQVENGTWPKDLNPLKLAPHTISQVASDSWDLPYNRQQAVFPVEALKHGKFWPAVSRVDGAYGDRHLVCSCNYDS
ncbi:MAG TPA: aminomethyl-transferring glycine dehydrogenase [Oligoflexia bacterium]|nr:aminomethyl-transferring glycine dehydrogenase [Oligoflexia bacterium]HMP26563.1 aminomethyl-transferring glycine dehydrogenase [Oligoflexia bacterium]